MDNLKSDEQAKAKFIEIFTPFIHQMSNKIVSNLNDILRQSSFKCRPQVFEEFKADMLDRWVDEFGTMWETKNLSERLNTLNSLKQQHAQSGAIEKAWRAHGRSAEQQTQFNRNRGMSIYLRKMQGMLEEQSIELKKLIFEIEERRAYFNEVSKRRSRILDDMDSKMACLQTILNEEESETEEIA